MDLVEALTLDHTSFDGSLDSCSYALLVVPALYGIIMTNEHWCFCFHPLLFFIKFKQKYILLYCFTDQTCCMIP